MPSLLRELQLHVGLAQLRVRRERRLHQGVAVSVSKRPPRHRPYRNNRGGQRQSHGFGELHAGDGEVARGRDLPLLHVRQVHVDGEDICFRDQAKFTTCARPPKIALRRGHGGIGGPSRGVQLQHAHERLRCPEGQVLIRSIPGGHSHLAAQPGCLHAESRQSRVEERLLEYDRGARIRHRFRMVERRNGKVGGREFPLREQRAEDKHRLVAALHGFRHVDSWPEARPRPLDTRVCFVDR
jgi:hypothetical protein